MTSKGVDLTVSIVSYHVAEELRACLESALGAAPRHDIEIIVVDNASGAATQAARSTEEDVEENVAFGA